MISFLLLISRYSSATISGPMPLSYLTSNSELIAKCEVLTVTEVDRVERVAKLRVDQVLKGTADKTVEVRYALSPDLPIELCNIIVPDEYALFFLVKKNGFFVPTYPEHMIIPVREGRGSQLTDPIEPFLLVREELLFTATGPPTISQEDKAKKELYKIASMKFGNPIIHEAFQPTPINVIAAKLLREFPAEKRTLDTLNTLVNSEDRFLRGATIATLLRLNQPKALIYASEYIHTSEKGNPFLQDVIRNIENVKDVTAIDPLSVLLQDQNAEVRNSAITALRATSRLLKKPGQPLSHLREGVTIPLFIHSLNDEDSQVRYQAIWALSALTSKPEWYPSYSPPWEKDFDPREERKSIERWKQWWEKEGQAEFTAKNPN